MRRFYQSVDLRSRSQMTDFLTKHFRYPTMNSWNNAVSYACNLKIHSLGLCDEVYEKLYDLLECQEFFLALKELMDAFAAEHNYRWQVGMNGRSGGYLVLYQGEIKPSGYKSFCTACGQLNYRSIKETGKQCGKCGLHTRVDFDKPHMQVSTFPGRGTDDDTDFTDWSMDELKAVSDSFRILIVLPIVLWTVQLILLNTIRLKKRNITFLR